MPYPCSATSRGIRMLQPRFASPAEKSWMLEVSCAPVSRRSLSLPSRGSYALMCLMWCLDRLSMAFSMAFMPPGTRMGVVEKFVWAPAPAVHSAGTHTTVVGTLGSRESILGPTKWMGVLVEQSVLLLNPEPGVLVLGLLHDLLASLPVVRVGWLLVVFVGFAHHQNVVTATEGIWVNLDGVEVGVRV